MNPLYTTELMIILFVILVGYSFLLYPIIIAILSKIFAKPINSSDEFFPDISIIISAYNEEKLIKAAVESVFNTNYPKEKIQVLIGSDGSTDNTVKILEEISKNYPQIKYFDYPRIGKNQVLNRISSEVNTGIVMFMDADCRLKANTIPIVVSKFADTAIGAVIASMHSISQETDDNAGREGEILYQKIETQIRVNESKIFSTVNSLGAFYAIRKEMLSILPNDKICDDYYPLLYTSLKRKRVIFCDEAVVCEVREKSLSDELSRRIRLAAGGMATVWHNKKLLLPNFGWVSFFLWSHKVLRWLSPIYLIIIAIWTILFPEKTLIYYTILFFQLIIYIFAFWGWLFEKMKIKFIPFRISLFFVSMNFGFLVGIIRFLLQGKNSIWERNQSK